MVCYGYRSHMIYKQYTITILIWIGIALTSLSCNLEMPENRLDFNRESPLFEHTNITFINPFRLEISHSLIPSDANSANEWQLYRMQSSEYNEGFKHISSILAVQDDSAVVFIDSTAIYRDTLWYYIKSFQGENGTKPSDTLELEFIIPPVESVELSLTLSKSIAINIQTNYSADKFEIQRMNAEGENISIIQNYSLGKVARYIDSLSLDFEDYSFGFEDGIHPYANLVPNREYVYRFRDIFIQDSLERYSDWTTNDTIVIPIDSLNTHCRAVNDSITRIYFSSIDTTQFDSIFIFIKSDNDNWNKYYSVSISNLFYYSFLDEWICDIPYPISENRNGDDAIFTAMSSNYYSLAKEQNQLHHLEISGFNLVEKGEFIYGGCIDPVTVAFPVTINTHYYLGQYEISEDWYINPMVEYQINQFPKNNISKDSAQVFAQIISSLFEDEFFNYTFELPTGIEWEYAAKHSIYNDVDYIYPWGNDIDAYDANYYASGIGWPVESGSYPGKSSFGLYDMSGNVMEWIADTTSDGLSIARGGAYYHDADHVQTTSLLYAPASTSDPGLGFRIKLILEEK